MAIKATFTADITSFRSALQQGEVRVRTFESTVATTNRRLQSFGERFSGARVIRDAELMQKSITAVGGAARLTDTQLRQVNRTLQEAAQAYARTGREAPKSVQRLTAYVNQLVTAQERAASSAQRLSGSGVWAQGLSAFAGGLGVGAGAGAGLAALQTAGSLVRGLAGEVSRLTPLRESFDRISGSAGAAAEALRDMRDASRGLITEADLLQAANKANLLGLTEMGVDMGELTRVAVTLGRAMGQDARKSVDDFTAALGRRSTAILDNLGITMKAEEAEAAHAARLGKSVQLLTDEERARAFAISAMEKAREKAAELGEAQLTLTEQGSRAVRVVTDLATSFGAGVDKAGLFSNMLGGVADGLTRVADDYENLQRRVAQANREHGSVARPTTISDVANATFSGWLASMGVAAAIPGVSSGAASIGEHLFTRTAWSRFAKLPETPTGMSPAEQRRLDAFGPRKPITFFDPRGMDDEREFQEARRKAIADADAAAAKSGEEAARLRIAALERVKAAQDKLIGADKIAAAETIAERIREVGTHRLDPAGIPALAEQLLSAEQRARALGEAITFAVGESVEELVRTPAYRQFFENLQKPPAAFDTIAAGRMVIGGAMQDHTIIPGGWTFGVNRGLGRWGQGAGSMGVVGGISGALQPDLSAGLKTTRDWRIEVQGVAEAFAQLAQVAGPALGGVNRVLGVSLSSVNVAQQVVQALNQRFEGFSSSAGGRALGGGLAGLTAGLSLGSLTSSRRSGFLAGAAGGAATGMMFGPLGAGIGAAVGGLAGLWAGGKNAAAQRAQLEQSRKDLVAQFGTIERLQRAAERAGFSVEHFMRRFNSSDAREFSDVVNALNQRLAEQRQRLEELVGSLDSVAKAQGVMSQQQLAQIRTMASDSEGAEGIVAWAEQQRRQSIQGILRAAEALARMSSLSDEEIARLTEGITDADERAAVIEQALRDRAGSIMGDLRAGVHATASAIFIAIEEAVASGEHLVDVLRDLAPAINTVRNLFSRAGQTPGAGFGQVESYQRIATGEQTGPALELALGLGQAMAAFTNTGLMSPELFQEMANGIGAAYKQMELLGQGGLDAARLMQPALQNIWQLIEDNPGLEDQLDDDTRALLDFAEKSGLIGDKFRPAVDRMIDALNRLIGKLDEWLERLAKAAGMSLPGVPDGDGAGGEGHGGGGGGGGTGTPGGGDLGSGGDYGGVTPFAKGGIVTSPTIGLVGEAGPEVIAPIERLPGLMGLGTNQTILVQVGREVIARAAVRGMPREWRVVGV